MHIYDVSARYFADVTSVQRWMSRVARWDWRRWTDCVSHTARVTSMKIPACRWPTPSRTSSATSTYCVMYESVDSASTFTVYEYMSSGDGGSEEFVCKTRYIQQSSFEIISFLYLIALSMLLMQNSIFHGCLTMGYNNFLKIQGLEHLHNIFYNMYSLLSQYFWNWRLTRFANKLFIFSE